MKNITNNENVLFGIIISLVGLLAIIILFPSVLNPIKANSGIYSVEIIKISGCNECFNLDIISANLDKINNIKIKSNKTLDYNSDEAKKLIDKYSITKVPALLIISRNIDKITLDEKVFRKVKNAAVFDKPAPYIDLSSGQVKGLVTLKEVYDSNCKECTTLSSIEKQLEQMQVKIKSYDLIDSSSEEGKKLIKENEISYLPTLLLSKEIIDYWWISNKILVEGDEYYKFNNPIFPYKDISSSSVKGIVKATYLVNNSCTECYDISELKPSLESLGIYIDSERFVDIASDEGKNLVILYNITDIPTVILSKQILDYTSIKEVLEKVGSFEKDNSFVLRNLASLNVKYQTIGGKNG